MNEGNYSLFGNKQRHKSYIKRNAYNIKNIFYRYLISLYSLGFMVYIIYNNCIIIGYLFLLLIIIVKYK